jgi:hypothetical protein
VSDGAGSQPGGAAAQNRGAALMSGLAEKVGPSMQRDRWAGQEKKEKNDPNLNLTIQKYSNLIHSKSDLTGLEKF